MLGSDVSAAPPAPLGQWAADVAPVDTVPSNMRIGRGMDAGIPPPAVQGAVIPFPATLDTSSLPMVPVASAGDDGAAAQGGPPRGVLDACINIDDTLALGADLVHGTLIDGDKPSGRICDSRTYVYTLRYGPLTSCGSFKAVSTAEFTAADTRAAGSSRTEVAVSVSACAPALVASIVTADAATTGRYEWAVSHTPRTGKLQLPASRAGSHSYSVAYTRSSIGGASSLNVSVSVRNPASSPVLLSEARYVVNTTCGGAVDSKSAAFNCAGDSIPAASSRECSFAVPLSCASAGEVGVKLTTVTGKVVTAPAVRFAEPAMAVLADTPDACIMVSGQLHWCCTHACCCFAAAMQQPCSMTHLLHQTPTQASHFFNQSLAVGQLATGAAPKGRLCGSRAFNFTTRFGPFNTCGRRRVSDESTSCGWVVLLHNLGISHSCCMGVHCLHRLLTTLASSPAAAALSGQHTSWTST